MLGIGWGRFHMNDKYAKEIAKEIKMIRRELERINKPRIVNEENKKLFRKMLKENVID